MTAKSKAPGHLSAQSRLWFASVLRDYELEDHHKRILCVACEAYDRANAAREIVEAEGVCIRDRWDVLKPNPACAIERDAKTTFLRALRELGLDVEGPGGSTRDVARPSHAIAGNGSRRKG